MEEEFETFDDRGRPTGLVARSRVHREGLWHRATNVLLFRSDGRLLVQRRHSRKDVWPGAWDLSAAEHLKPGETYEEGAKRGLLEELGVGAVDLEPVGGVVRQRLDDAQAGLRDYELQQTFRGVFDGEVSPAPEEVSEIRAVILDELASALDREPASFTPWFRRCITDSGLLSRR